MSIFNPLESLKYCEAEVKKKDLGSYVHGLFMPPEIRAFYYVAQALRLELVKSRESVQHSSLMATKMQWWLDNLDAIWSSAPAEEPISIAVSELRKYHVVRKSHFERMVKGSFEESAIKNWRAFDRYIDNNYTMVYYILIEILHFFNEAEFEAATYAGRSWGIMTLLMRTKYYADRGRFYFPEELMAKYSIPLGVSVENEETHVNELPESFYDVVLEVAAYGKQNLQKVYETRGNLHKNSYFAFLQMKQAEYFYAKLEKHNFKIFEPKAKQIFWPSVLIKTFNCARKRTF